MSCSQQSNEKGKLLQMINSIVLTFFSKLCRLNQDIYIKPKRIEDTQSYFYLENLRGFSTLPVVIVEIIKLENRTSHGKIFPPIQSNDSPFATYSTLKCSNQTYRWRQHSFLRNCLLSFFSENGMRCHVPDFFPVSKNICVSSTQIQLCHVNKCKSTYLHMTKK